MLDALKFAFEILIVGALALPWLAILSQMLEAVGPSATLPAFLNFIPDAARTTVTVAMVIAFGYVVGSVVSRTSRDLFNDELLRPLPTEDLIRIAVYQGEYCGQDQMNVNENAPRVGEPQVFSDDSDLFEDSVGQALPLHPSAAIKTQHSLHEKYRNAFCPTEAQVKLQHLRPGEITEKIEQHITSMFRLQEGEMLLLGEDKVGRLKQYYDQITVLRGAAFNGFVLLVICLVGCCANLRVRAGTDLTKTLLAYLPAATLFGFGIYELGGHYEHIKTAATHLHHSGTVLSWSQKTDALYNDPPLAELVLILLGAVGLLVIFKAKKTTPYFRTALVAAIITTICLGAWWWTEIIYDLQVVHSQVELRPNPLIPVPAAGPVGATAGNPAAPNASPK
jgi:hypothetical protein